MLSERQQLEVDYWRNRQTPTTTVLVNKLGDASVFLHLLAKYRPLFRGYVLELGCGQGWASCIVKREIPDANVTATDISHYAIEAIPDWERVFDVKIDNRYACQSHNTNEKDASIDLAFAFASAHHFATHDETLGELNRILKPGGSALYLYEPTSNEFFYPMMYWRVNKKRDIPEDVIVPSRMRQLCAKHGLEMRLDFFSSTIKRGPVETVYYSVLSALPFLKRVLPCSASIIITKS